MNLILASTSKYRAGLLRRLGREFIQISPDVDEDAFKAKSTDGKTLANDLALAKANAALIKAKQTMAPTIVIGGDQVIIFQNTILGKPHTQARALQQIKSMAGKQHVLYSAVALVGHDRDGHPISEVFGVEAKMTMWPLQEEEIERYIAQDLPLDCAGSYKLEQGGIRLFEKIETSDFTTIEGLPLIELEKRLRSFSS